LEFSQLLLLLLLLCLTGEKSVIENLTNLEVLESDPFNFRLYRLAPSIRSGLDGRRMMWPPYSP
jgi:hypothetical protein